MVPYSIIRCIDVCHWLSWEHSYNVVILEGIEINEQLSLRNSLNALCYQTNYGNFVFPTMFMNEVLKLTSSCHERIR